MALFLYWVRITFAPATNRSHPITEQLAPFRPVIPRALFRDELGWVAYGMIGLPIGVAVRRRQRARRIGRIGVAVRPDRDGANGMEIGGRCGMAEIRPGR
jgi:hypothetical protein